MAPTMPVVTVASDCVWVRKLDFETSVMMGQATEPMVDW